MHGETVKLHSVPSEKEINFNTSYLFIIGELGYRGQKKSQALLKTTVLYFSTWEEVPGHQTVVCGLK